MRKKVFVCLLSAVLVMSNVDVTAVYATEKAQQESQETEYSDSTETEPAVETESELMEGTESEAVAETETIEVESETKSEEQKTSSANETHEEASESTQTASDIEKTTEPETVTEIETETISESESGTTGPETVTEPETIPEAELGTTEPDTMSETETETIETDIQDNNEGERSGKCGDNLTWTLDDNGKLTISGTGDMYDYERDKAPWGKYKSELVSLEIGDGVTTIGEWAFACCDGLKGKLIIPDSVITIGDGAFGHCYGFTGDLIIPDGVTTIGDYAFNHCDGLKGKLIIPDSVITIGDYAFTTDDQQMFTGDLIIPDSVISIGDGAFAGCGFTGKLVIPDSITTIADYTFFECGFTGKLVIPSSVISIGDGAFTECMGLTGELVLSKCVKTIGRRAFEDCPFTGELVIPDSVTTISDGAFVGCYGFTGELVIPDSVTAIGNFVFGGCYGFTGDLVIPDSITSIGDRAFVECYGFTGDLVIPKHVKTIGEYAFYNCKKLSGKVYIPMNVTTIGKEAFDEIPNLCIYGIKGSYAANYAKSNNIPFEGVDESVWGEPASEDSDGVLPEDMPEGGEAAIPQGIWVAGIDNNGYTYTGSAITPEVRVYDNNKRLKAGIDYTITYKNNTKANDASGASTAPSVVVKTMGNYSGSKTVTFKILPVDLNSVDIQAEDLVLANNNQVQKKVPTLTFNGKKLANNKDFTVSYPATGADAYKATGTYDVLVTAKQGGNFTGSRVVKLTITDSTLISKASVKKIVDQPYTGEALTPKPQLTLKGKPLAEGIDYMLSYADNTEIGTAKVIIRGIGAYAGTREITFKITGKPIKSAKVSITSNITSNITYNGEEQTPKIALTMNGAPLKEDEDYTIKYQSNVNAGTATVTISGIKSYYGTLKKTFKIAAYDLAKDSDKSLTGLSDAITVNYVKGGSTPKVNLQFKGKTLVEGVDYTISYKNNKAVTSTQTKKSPTLTIKGKGNFKGSITKAFTITPKDLNDVTMMVPNIAFVDKSGKYISKPVLTDTDGKKLVAGTDYEKKVEYKLEDGTVLDGQSKAGIGTKIIVTVTGKGAYTGTKTGSYIITKSDFGKAKISISQQAYTGKPVVLGEKDITVKIGTTTLKYGTDYEIVADSYTNNIKKGTASVIIVGKGEYGGMKQAKFKIVVKKF